MSTSFSVDHGSMPTFDPSTQDLLMPEPDSEHQSNAHNPNEDDLAPEDLPPRTNPNPLAPPGLKEISSLASWTVSSAKPDCGISALRSTRLDHFWQSDDPQPHCVSIHFFKLVQIVHIRVLLDFESDESYTPTKLQFWAGMGAHDMHEFSELALAQPQGWIDVDFSKVGPMGQGQDWESGPVLRAFLVQVRIIENHQNGKDTRLRGIQLFARDDAARTTRQFDAVAAVNGKTSARRIDAEPLSRPAWLRSPELR